MRANHATSFNSEINVTPLVDVCLVLLIIFMVVLPTLVNGVPVNLPETSSNTSPDDRLIQVTVKEDLTVYIDTLAIRRDEVPATLERLHASSAARPIGVRADKRVPYGDVVDVLDACRKAGWADVTLIAQQRAGSR